MQQYIELLQGYYKFLSLGKFFEAQAQTHLLSLSHQLSIATGECSKFSINAELTSSLLAEIYHHPHSKNVFGYLTEISAFRGIFSVMREMIEKVPLFRNALKTIFGEQYLAFEQTIRFLRNVLTHSSTPSLLIQAEDFQKQKIFLASKKNSQGQKKAAVKKVSLHFVYKEHVPEREGSPDYICEAEIDFSSLKEGISLWKIISLHQMYLLSELCYNISKVINARIKYVEKKTAPKKPKKRKILLGSKKH